MKQFMDKDFLLDSEAAKVLYHEHAAKMPIIDYHCHINPQEIADDRRYENISEVWLSGDHYKWRAMRCCGIPESDITGAKDSDPYRAFLAFAKTMPRIIGNPLYHWAYLELKKYFGITEELSEKTAESIYNRCNERLREPGMSVRGLIEQSNVKLICTTDDPVDDLRYHRQIAEDETCKVKVLPALRPDKALNIDKPGFAEYIEKLAAAAKTEIKTFDGLVEALYKRIDYFKENGAKVSDHGLDYCCYEEASKGELDEILALALSGGAVSQLKADKFKTGVLVALAKKYYELNWVMQIHFGCLRCISKKMFKILGADTGYDAMGNSRGADKLAALLNRFEEENALPKMVLYSLNQYDNEIIATIAGSFQTDSPVPSRIQLGSAWWFNDQKLGMIKQLTDLANLGSLGSFIGMLTDSRSFTSYTRHEYFRRILCNLIGGWGENGEVYADLDSLGEIVEDICYNNTVNFFGFGEYVNN